LFFLKLIVFTFAIVVNSWKHIDYGI